MSAFGQQTNRWLVVLLIAGAMARVAVLPLGGTSDVVTQKLWSFGAATDVTGIYGVGGDPTERRLIHWHDVHGPVDYPPLAILELAPVGRTYIAIDPEYRDSTLLTILIKIPGLIVEALFVVLLLTWGRRLLGSPAAEWAAMAFWINPAIWFTGSGLGYVDAQAAVPAALALLAATTNRPGAAGALMAIAAGTKPQTVFFLPIVAAIILGGRRPLGWRPLGRAALWGALTSALIVAPFVLRGATANMLQGVSRLLYHDMLSAQAPNLGWIATWALRVWHAAPEIGWYEALTLKIRILQLSRALALGYPDPRPIATALTLGAVGLAAWRASRGVSRPLAAALAAWAVYAYTILGVPVHENHFYAAVPVFTLAAAETRSLRAVYWVASGIFALNIYLFYGLGQHWPPVIDRTWTVIDLTVLLAVANVGVFIWATKKTWAEGRSTK